MCFSCIAIGSQPQLLKPGDKVYCLIQGNDKFYVLDLLYIVFLIARSITLHGFFELFATSALTTLSRALVPIDDLSDTILVNNRARTQVGDVGH